MISSIYEDTGTSEIDEVIDMANDSFFAFKNKLSKQRANFLYQIAQQLERIQSDLLETAQSETNLGMPRLETELIRTIDQLKEFARLAENNSWKDFIYEAEDINRDPIPKPAMFRNNVPLGPVAVIGACNFPFAISVVGTDTAGALAVGCPVIVKSHPGHPQTCELQGKAVKIAIKEAEMPNGCFALIHGENYEVARQLVAHPKICCVAFTGSLRGGKALAKVVSERQKPIPFHAEMGSLNPVFALPSALSDNSDSFAKGFINAINLFAGQMCTKPGALIILAESFNENFRKNLISAISSNECLPLLNKDVFQNYNHSVGTLKKRVRLIGKSQFLNETHPLKAHIQVFQITAKEFLQDEELQTESFGPSSLIVVAEDFMEMMEIAHHLEGSLTGTIHAGDKDQKETRELLPVLTSKVGRILWNGFPPGVIPGPATHHGGPWPSTTDSRFTSIGIQGYKRFVRPVCWQGFPESSGMS
ncbi:MAG: aldehyde dehydrogenase (NADP(+)) [Verrucomicrobiota bacterium]|nr:aldehyde dehydrogenase (NADP(+)) [Verrucomicrobiota bacterium]